MCAWESLVKMWVNSGLPRGEVRWLQQSWEARCAAKSPFEGLSHYHHYFYHSLASGQSIGREHSPTHQQKIGIKISWEWPCPLEQDPVFPIASLSHQEASTNLLSSSIRGKTERKPQSESVEVIQSIFYNYSGMKLEIITNKWEIHKYVEIKQHNDK